MEDKPWLDYTGESTDALIKLGDRYRVDSIVCAFETAIIQKASISEWAELVVLVVETMEREVNNGGFGQLLLNGADHVPFLLSALESIGCVQTLNIAGRALASAGFTKGMTPREIAALRTLDGSLSNFDQEYFDAREDIEGLLFRFICDHRDQIVIP